MERNELSDKDKILVSAVIFLASSILMCVSQSPSDSGLSPFGALLAIVSIISGVYTAMGALFTWG